MPEAAAPRHVPVLLEAVIRLLGPALEGGGWWADVTVGLGGHSAAILERYPETSVVVLDRDSQALKWAEERLAPFGPRVRFVNAPFSHLEESVRSLGIGSVRALLADLGVSSMQLDHGERGFSFQQDGPLDMRMGRGEPAPGSDPTHRGTRTAEDIVNRYPEEELANILRTYGEEKQAKRIARGIVAARREAPIRTTGQLARLVERLKPEPHRPRSGRRRLHPATQVFQALRIEVNQELDQLGELLDQSVKMLDKD
ncbi:MAG: 16S rRNA (cytosine(1402)-N(4))-methyltransferase RsmH, partial [Holophagales bacterium]|nr:16S rRNA (cytosine(1402)-N(4))-methyltransferase RsmH [Holophagales bacterium]